MSSKKCLLAMFCAVLALALAACELGGSEEAIKPLTLPYISIHPQSHSYYNAAYANNSAYVYPGTPPTLGVEIWDWQGNDGSLSYQWYTFTDIEDYCENGGRAIPGATSGTYTPPISSTANGTKYYYYVTVTNSKSDVLGDQKEASLTSEVAVISFSNPGQPLAPILSRSPSDARYAWGAAFNPMQLKAAIQDSGTISYQWYSNKAYKVDFDSDTTTAAAVNMGTQASLMPDVDDLDMGDNFYFAVVTNTIGSNRSQTITIPAKIEIVPGKRAAAPRITTQPTDKLYFTGDVIEALTAEAESLDRGAITYQWYSNDVAAVNSGTRQPIAGATNKNYTPDINTGSAAGPFYYYVVATNTNENVIEETTATTASKPVKVRVAAPGTEDYNISFTIPDPSLPANRFQYVRGYGGMDVAWGNFPLTDTDDTELMYDPERLGYNMLRIMIKADYLDPEETINMLLGSDRPYYYENVRIVNKYGGYVAASPWTPPKNWKSNNSINGGGILIPAYYKLFATYLRNFAQIMYDNGAPIYCISISNEPNYVAGYDGCEWTPNEMRDFYLECGHFTDGVRGWGGGKETPYVLTMNGESANTPNINLAALQNPKSKAAIDVLARHIYGSRKVSLWNENKQHITKKDAEGNDVMMEVWMTEHNINSSNATGYYNDSKWPYVWRYLNDVDLVMRINNENAFVWWASKRFYSMVGDGQFGAPNHTPLPRGWALTHYSRYTIDHTRVAVNLNGTGNTTGNGTPVPNIDWTTSVVNNSEDNMDNPSPRITAFAAPDGNSISVVLFTPTSVEGAGGYGGFGTMEINLPFAVSGVVAHKSYAINATTNSLFQPFEEITLSADRRKAYITMPQSQIISVRFTK
ncbi:MAG: hypothetical protein LBB72_07825 [Spirochaetaceae bacterium]|nr:hypothetical protein [Spirochaetaceae bacterium]